MGFQRRVLQYGYDGEELLGEIAGEAIAGCWFELHRQGGCGAGELRLKTEFTARQQIEPGQWIAFEYTPGDRWYFGRVEEVDCGSPGGMRIELEGASIELNEVFPGSLVPTAEGVKPHRYSRTDRFSQDPDRAWESVDPVLNSRELIGLLLKQYVVPGTGIRYVPDLLESGLLANDVTSVKFHGEESVRSILKDLALRAGGAAWGVDERRRFFFLQSRTEVLDVYRENRDLTRLNEVRSRSGFYNRVVLTGDYIYDRRDGASDIARRSFRWRGNYRHTGSVGIHGERRIRLWVPWMRTAEDSRAFVTEFFRRYAYPVRRFLLETGERQSVPRPWLGVVELLDRTGALLTRMQPETIRVRFDHVPRLRMELGPGDPHDMWPEPPEDERFELPDVVPSGFGGSDFATLGNPSEVGGPSSSGNQTNQQTDVTSELGSFDSLESEMSDSSADSLSSDDSQMSSASSVWISSSEEESSSEGNGSESGGGSSSVGVSTETSESGGSSGSGLESSWWSGLTSNVMSSGVSSEMSSGVSSLLSGGSQELTSGSSGHSDTDDSTLLP